MNMFDEKKSLVFVYSSILIILILIFIIISGFFVGKNKGYSTIKKDNYFSLDDTKLKLIEINKSNDFLYLEFVNENWLNTNFDISFYSTIEKNPKEKIEEILKLKFKGYYLIKIPVTKNYGAVKLVAKYNEKEFATYFNEKDLKINNYKELNLDDYKRKYLNYLVDNNKKKIKELEQKISEQKNKKSDIEKKKNELNSQLKFQVGDDLVVAKQKILDFDTTLQVTNSEILKYENEIIELKNKNLVLTSEVNFIKTGKENSIVLLKKKDLNGELIEDFSTQENIKNETEKQKEEIKNNSNSEKNNSPSSNSKVYSPKPEVKTPVEKSKSSSNKSTKKTSKSTKKTKPVIQNKPDTTKPVSPKNPTNKIIKPTKPIKNNEVELEFIP